MNVFTGGRYTNGFEGCVHVVEGLEDGSILLNKNAISGVNVDSCPKYEFLPLNLITLTAINISFNSCCSLSFGSRNILKIQINPLTLKSVLDSVIVSLYGW